MRLTVLALLLALGGCGVSAEDECKSIKLGTPLTELPVSTDTVWTNGMYAAGPVMALRCCYACRDSQQCSSCGVDCSAQANQATPHDLGGRYDGYCMAGSGRLEGGLHCTVWEQEGKVAAVSYFCQD